MLKLREEDRTGTAGALWPAGAVVGALPCDWAADCRNKGLDRGLEVASFFSAPVNSAYAGAAATVTSGACTQKADVVPNSCQQCLTYQVCPRHPTREFRSPHGEPAAALCRARMPSAESRQPGSRQA